jgi:ankyrin repeat protein
MGPARRSGEDGRAAAHFKEYSFDILSCLVKELGVDVNYRRMRGLTVLHGASFWGYHDTIHYLVEELGADFDIPDDDGETPLY